VAVEPAGEVYRVKVEVAQDVEYDPLTSQPHNSNAAQLSLHWGLHRGGGAVQAVESS
jgi:hypothetical protein